MSEGDGKTESRGVAPARSEAQASGSGAPAGHPPASAEPRRAGSVVRIAAIALCFVLAFLVAFLITRAVDAGQLTACEDVTSPTQLVDGNCFDGSASEKSRVELFGWIGGGLAAISLLVGLLLATTGRGRLLFVLATAATLIALLLATAI